VQEENLYSMSAADVIIRYLLVDSVSANVYEYHINDSTQGTLIDSLKCQEGDRFGEGYICNFAGNGTILDYETEYKEITQALPDWANDHTLAKDIGISYQYHDISEGWGGYKKFDLVYAFIGGNIYGGIVNSVRESNVKPAESKLLQNYPNPFNPITNFKYKIPAAGAVDLSIFTTSGQKIATLINRFQSAGIHTIRWDANALPSGLYLYRLQAGKYTKIKKLVIIH
jgi:hypothetical protein